MLYLHCVVKFQLRKLDCALTWYENAVFAIAELRCPSTESTSSLRKLRGASEIKKIKLAFCAALSLVEKIVALCCAALLV